MERSVVRRVVRNPKNGLNGNWQQIVEYVVNLSFANETKNGKGYFNPPLDAVAKKFGKSRRFVQMVFAWMKAEAGLTAIGYQKGGRKAVRYVLDIMKLMERLAPSGVKEVAGELSEIRAGKEPVKGDSAPQVNCDNPAKFADVIETLHSALPQPEPRRDTLGVDRLVDGLIRILKRRFDPSKRRTADRSALHGTPLNWCRWHPRINEVPF